MLAVPDDGSRRVCAVEPFFADLGRTKYPRIKKAISGLARTRRGATRSSREAASSSRELYRQRTTVERDFSFIKDRGCFGADGQARVSIRGLDNYRLRFPCSLIPLAVLSLHQLGVQLSAKIADLGLVDEQQSHPNQRVT